MSRILLLLEHRENRRLLASWLNSSDWLDRRYEVIAPADEADFEQALRSQSFDLCIIGGRALDRLWQTVQEKRAAEHPVLLPVLLSTSRTDVKYLTRHLWRSIDELITKPIEKVELQARVEILLRSRQLSLQVQAATQATEQQSAARQQEASERQRAELARQQAESSRDQAITDKHQIEDRFKSLVESNVIGMILADSEGNITSANAAFLSMVGYTEADLALGKVRWDQMTPPEYQQADERSIEQLRSTGVCTPFEKEYLRADGSRVPVLVGVVVVEATARLDCVAFVVDLTERKQSEAARRQSEARLQFVLDAARIGEWELDLTAQPCAARRSLTHDQIFGYESLQPEWTHEIFLSHVLPADREMVEQQFARTLSEWVDLDFECRIVRFDRQVAWIWIRGNVQRDTDQSLRLAGIVVDITEKKQATAALHENERQLSLALKTGRLGSWRLDLDRRTLTTSDQCKANFGLSADADLSHTRLFELIHPDDRPRVQAALEQAIASHSEYNVEYRTVWLDGSIHWLLVRGSCFYDTAAVPLYMVGMSMDITDRKQAEAAQEVLLSREQAARTQAETANRIKDEFLAVLSHELRTPLNPILGWSKLLRSRPFDPATTDRALETIERNAHLQTQLIEDLLDVSRILSGKLVLNAGCVTLDAVVGAAIETVRLAAEAKAIQLQIQLEPDLPPILGDANRLQQAVWNLLSNAIKFTPAQGTVTVQLARQAQEETQQKTQQRTQWVQITVSDTGKGIPAAFLPHVFESFRQADGSTTRTFGGLGLGLAIVRQVVELHSGEVAADSSGEGQGATFTIRLPLRQSRPAPTSIVQPAAPQSRSAPLSGAQILLVDDEADTRDVMAFVLEQAGASVVAVASAKEALAAFAAHKPTLLLSDIGMPEMDGYSLIQQIRSLPDAQQLPAIALTAYAGESDRRQALAAGFQSHLAKPIEPERLVQAIARVMGSGR